MKTKSIILTSVVAMCAVVGGSFTSFASNFNPSANPQWTGGNTAPIDPLCGFDSITFTPQQAAKKWRIDYMCMDSGNELNIEAFLTTNYGNYGGRGFYNNGQLITSNSCFCGQNSVSCVAATVHDPDFNVSYNSNTYSLGYATSYCWLGGSMGYDSVNWDLITKCVNPSNKTVRNTCSIPLETLRTGANPPTSYPACSTVTYDTENPCTTVGFSLPDSHNFYSCTENNTYRCLRPHEFDAISNNPTATVTQTCRAGSTDCGSQTISNYRATVESYGELCSGYLLDANGWFDRTTSAWLCVIYDKYDVFNTIYGMSSGEVGFVEAEYVYLDPGTQFYGVVRTNLPTSASSMCDSDKVLATSFPNGLFVVCDDPNISKDGSGGYYEEHFNLLCVPGIFPLATKNITFNYNGGTVGNNTQTTVSTRINTGINVPTTTSGQSTVPIIPSRTGYQFTGWKIHTGS